MYRVGLITKTNKPYGASFETREEVDQYILELDEKEGVKRFRIEKDGELIETEEGAK